MSHIASYQCECLKIANTQIVPEDLSSPYQTTIFRRKYILLLTKAFRFPWVIEQYLNKIKIIYRYVMSIELAGGEDKFYFDSFIQIEILLLKSISS